MKPRTVGVGAVTIIAAAMAFIQPWENGPHTAPTHPYNDGVGVMTVCTGHAGAERRVYSQVECAALFLGDVRSAYSAVDRCVRVPLTAGQWVALISFQFNTGAACRSSALRLANAGKPAGQWCPLLGRYVYGGGHKLRGLVRRRAAEVALCLKESP